MAQESSVLNSTTAIADTATDHASLLSADVALPAGKLDADQYGAEDLDGVTESLFGSGNLNYLTLQGRQTDAMLASNGFESGARAQAADHALSGLSASSHALAAINAGNLASSVSSLSTPDGGGASALQDGHMRQENTQPSLSGNPGGGADAAHGVTTPTLPGNGLNGLSGLNGIDIAGHDGIDGTGHNGSNGSGNDGGSGNNGNNGNNGHDGHNPPPPDPPGPPTPTPTDIDLSAHNSLGLPGLDLNLDPIEHIVGDIDVGVGQTLTPNGPALTVHATVAGIPLLNDVVVPAIPGVTDHLYPAVDAVANLINPDTLAHDPVGSVGMLADGLAGITGLDLPAVSPLLEPVASALAPVTDALAPITDTALSLVTSSALQGPVTDIGNLADHLVSATGLDTAGMIGGLSPLTDQIAPLIDTLLGTAHADGLTQDPASTADSLLSGAGLGLPGIADAVSSVTGILDGNALTANPVATVDNLLNPVLDGANLSGVLHDLTGGALPDVSSVTDIVSTLTTGGVPDVSAVSDLVSSVAGGSGLGDILAQLPDTGGLLGGITQPAGDATLFVHNDAGLPQIDLPNPVSFLTGDGATGLGLTHGADSAGATVLLSDTPVVSQDIPVSMPATPVVPDLTGTASSILGQISALSSTTDHAITLIPPVTTGTTSGADAVAWPTTADSGASSSLPDTLGSLIGGAADAAHALPAPAGSVSEGLGLLNIGSDHGGGSLSGLHSGHHGGLFG